MEVILKQDLDDLGMEGDVVDVAKGYARNYLVPKGLALEASPQNISAFKLQRKKVEARRIKARESAETLKKQLEDMELTIEHKAGEEGKLYGSVTSMEISDLLGKKGVVIDRKKIVLDKPIKELGAFQAAVKLYPEVTAVIRGTVVPEEEG